MMQILKRNGKKISRRVNEAIKCKWERAARAGQGYSWDWEHEEAAGEEQREFRESRSEGHISGFKGTELMQVPDSGLGGRCDSHRGRVMSQLIPRTLEEQAAAMLACLPLQGYWAQSAFRRALSSPALTCAQRPTQTLCTAREVHLGAGYSWGGLELIVQGLKTSL